MDDDKFLPEEFAKNWYHVDEVQRYLAQAEEVPTDVKSREFAAWLTDQYRRAMHKGLQVGLRVRDSRRSAQSGMMGGKEGTPDGRTV